MHSPAANHAPAAVSHAKPAPVCLIIGFKRADATHFRLTLQTPSGFTAFDELVEAANSEQVYQIACQKREQILAEAAAFRAKHGWDEAQS